MSFKTLTTTLLLSTSFLLFTACNSKTTQEEANATTVQNPTTTETTVDTSVDTDTSTDDDDTVTGTETTGEDDSTDTTPQTQADTTPPKITLNGKSNIALTKGDVYEELGATATDAVDGTVSVSISGSVDTSTVGTYTMTYSATDSSGNSASVTRSVNVEKKINKIKTLTLTSTKTHFVREKESDIHPYYPIVAPLKVVATYEDGQSEEVTDMVTWESDISGLSVDKYGVKLVKGDFRITTSLDRVTSNSVMIKVEDDDKAPKFLRVKVRNNDDESYPNRKTSINLALVHKPTEDVKVKLTLKESDGMRFYTYETGGALTKEITFSPSKYRHYLPENIYLLEHNIKIINQDTNNTNPYTVIVEPLESQDPFFDSKDPTDIVVEKQKFSIIEPPLQQRRGAIRGVTIMFQLLSKARGKLTYTLVNPPKGMKIVGDSYAGMGATKFGVDVEWKVPMDIEEKIYNITAKATDSVGESIEINFPIKVPKTTPIQIKIVNNELIVTDKSSTLYGMKMKGHSGEDISGLRLRSMEYGDVWKRNVKPLDSSEEIEYIVYIIDNLPNQLDIKFPPYMDNFDTERMKKGISINQYIGAINIPDCWGWRYGKSFLYEGTDGVTIPRVYSSGNYKIEGSKLFMITINEK